MYENYEDQQWEQPGGPYWTEPVKPKKSGMGKVVALTLVCSLLSGALGAGAVLFWNRNEVKAPETTHILESNRTQVQLEQVESGEEMTPAQVYAQNVNSTVGITTSITTNYWGYQTTSAASGSGFILTEDGYILTNYHVIEGSDSISVSCYDGTTYDATLIGYDAGNDIAVLKVAAENLTPVVLGDSDTLRSIVAFCAQNYSENLSLSLLQERLHLDKYYIPHLFNDKLKIRFNDYINALRINEACRFLANTESSITEISELVGFNTLRTFNRAFMKHVGSSPSDYRKRYATGGKSGSDPALFSGEIKENSELPLRHYHIRNK